MTTTITVRGLDPQDKSWLRHEARTRGVSMEALVRLFIQLVALNGEPPLD